MPVLALFLVAVLVGSAACERATDAVAAPRTLRVAGGPNGDGPFDRILEGMTQAYQRRHSNVRIEATGGRALSNAADVQEGRVDIGLTFSNVAHVAFKRGKSQTPYGRLRAIAVLHVLPIHLLVHPDAGIHTLEDLRGKRIGVGLAEAGASTTVEFVLQEIGWTAPEIDLQTGRGATELLSQRKLDAVMRISLWPLDLVGEARVVPIAGPAVDRLLRTYPFLVRAVLPAGTYPSMPRPVPTIGVHRLLICRDDLPEPVVYDFAQQFFKSLSEVSSSLEALRTMRLDESSATPIPLHPGAARFYRERELQR